MRSTLRPLSALLTGVLLIGALATVPSLAQKAALPASTAAAWQQKLDPGTRMLYNAATAAGKRGTPLRAAASNLFSTFTSSSTPAVGASERVVWLADCDLQPTPCVLKATTAANKQARSSSRSAASQDILGNSLWIGPERG